MKTESVRRDGDEEREGERERLEPQHPHLGASLGIEKGAVHVARAGSVVRAAAAVQRAAERATLDRNDYSGARISQEAASVLSPGAIALVNGRTAHSPAELQAQLSGVCTGLVMRRVAPKRHPNIKPNMHPKYNIILL
jgi:hypothetical protein